MTEQVMPRVCFVTLGCAKNEVDSANMTARVLQCGFQVVEDPETADAVVINTCCFIQAATEESIEAIFDVCGLDNFVQGDAKLVVAGCMPARYGQDLETELPEAQSFVPCSKEDDIALVLCGLFGMEAPEQAVGPVSETSPFSVSPASYVKISDGCDRFCSFCAIPYIRGRYHSFTAQDIHDEVSKRVSEGVREITLIAQDTGCWGREYRRGKTPEQTRVLAEMALQDTYETPLNTAQLLDSLARAFPDTWFRVMYMEPEGVTDQLLRVIAGHDNICNYLDVPFQHASPSVIRAMNRKGSGADYLALIERMRDAVPGITLRTTLISGFPGETQQDHEMLLDFLEEAQLDYVGVFPYSREEGTAAAEMEGQIDEDVAISRAQEIRDLCDSIGEMRVAQRIGQVMDVVVLGCEEDGQLYGRAMCQGPEVDGVVYLESGEPGQVISVEISDTLVYEMEGEVVDGR